MATPITSGRTAMRMGSGRRSAGAGGAGRVILVARGGGSSRGGRLKSMPAPSADRVSAAPGSMCATRPTVTGAGQPAGLPMLTTAPSRSGDCASGISGDRRRPPTKSGGPGSISARTGRLS